MEKPEIYVTDFSHSLGERIRVKLNSGLVCTSQVEGFLVQDNG